jgi:hypothetical protein
MRFIHRSWLAALVCGAIAAVAVSPLAVACPSCRLGEEVRASVFGGDFLANAVMLALPLIILLSIASLLYRVGHPASRREPQR